MTWVQYRSVWRRSQLESALKTPADIEVLHRIERLEKAFARWGGRKLGGRRSVVLLMTKIPPGAGARRRDLDRGR